MNARSITFYTVLTTLLSTAPALASTMPRADFVPQPVVAVGGGQGIGLSFDAPVAPGWALGASIGSRAFSGANADIRGLFRFWNQGRDPLTVAALLGAQAFGPAFSSFSTVEPMAGLAGAYAFGRGWTVRGNLVVGVLGGDTFRPAGIEVGYRFHPRMEATVGFNGRGDFLGLNLSI